MPHLQHALDLDFSTVRIEREPGVWMVRTALVIPENELWLHQPPVKQRLQRALAYAQANAPKEMVDADGLLKDLEAGLSVQ
ncbi:MAG: hypothetical protein PHU06_12485 [Gallionella sp.]|nr:hypothetical protein [Gallionella sp.]MDD4959442.1 hypothetical protein [Gallionella sp.]